MAKIKYLYIDDEEEANAVADGLNDANIIEVDLMQPDSFEVQKAYIKNKLKHYNGLILDLRLDDNPASKAKYTAPSLAQELRFDATLNSSNMEFPIVLCSTDSKIQNSYSNEHTSHDLFDAIFVKEGNIDYQTQALNLQSLAKGYNFIKKNSSDLNKIIGRNISELDNRIFSKFLGEDVTFAIHDLARFIKNELIAPPGPLINEEMVAARLGVDIKKSSGWKELLALFTKKTKYNGVFSDVCERWWADLLLNAFKEITGQRLSAFAAPERVNLLIEHTNIKGLITAIPIKRAVSNNFWTICAVYKTPLDPLEAFKAYAHKEPYPWQEYNYLSFDAALERKGKIHISEKERYKKVKDLIEEQESK